MRRGLPNLAAAIAVLAAIEMLPGGQAHGRQRDSALDAAEVRAAVRSVAAAVDREYFDAAAAARVAASLNRWIEDGRYDRVTRLESLAPMLTRDLFDLTGDKHLAVAVLEDRPSAPASTDQARAARGRRENYGVTRVEILAGNVGYLDLQSFYRPDEARQAITAAMSLLRGADALILDLRENGGGSPDTVVLLASHLFEAAGMPLFEIVPRSGSGGRRYATVTPALAERDPTRPIFVLTGPRTFSAGEGLAFLLQERRRAEIVGERTAGAANPGRAYRVSDRLEVTIPNGQVRSAVSGRNWEGRGVEPDVTVPAAGALQAAHVRALRRLIERAQDPAWQSILQRELERLERTDAR
jgi:C-terminal processing protease CtpA/Prc